MTVYAWCESARQVERFLGEVRGGSLTVDRWVAVMPAGAWALRRRGLPYERLHDGLGDPTLCGGSEEALAAFVDWTIRLDDELQQSVPPWAAAGFRPAHLTAYFLRLLLDAVQLCAETSVAFLRRDGAARHVGFAAPAPHLSWHGNFYQSVYATILPHVAEATAVPYAVLPAIERDDLASFEGFWPERPALRALQALWRRIPEGLRTALRDRLGGAHRAPTPAVGTQTPRVVIGRGYDLEVVRRAAAAWGIAPGDWSALISEVDEAAVSVPDVDPGVWREVKARPWCWEVARPAGVDLRAVVEPRLDAWWTDCVQPMWRAFAAARELLPRRATALLTAPAWGPVQLGTQGAARALGIPVLTHQHGGFVGYCQNIALDVHDLGLADYTFVYGEGVARTLRERVSRTGRPLARPLVAGSARLDDLAGGISPDRRSGIRRRLDAAGCPLVLYVPTAFAGYARQRACDTYPDVAYFEMQCRILELFARRPDVRLAYKAFVSNVPNPMLEAIRRLCPTARYVTAPKLTELMWAADVVVIDYPSTALIEVALTDRPIVLLADRSALRLRPEAREHLARRVTLTESFDDFEAALAELLARPSFEPLRAVDRGFELAYSRFLADGRSAERVLQAVLEIAAGRPPRDVAWA